MSDRRCVGAPSCAGSDSRSWSANDTPDIGELSVGEETELRRALFPFPANMGSTASRTPSNLGMRTLSRSCVDLAVCDAIQALFEAIDTDGLGAINADDLLAVVGADAVALGALDHEAFCSLIREVDLNQDRRLMREEFAALFHQTGSAWAGPGTPSYPGPEHGTNEHSAALPHLTLFFDVNQTVLMIDSATGGDVTAVLNTVLANAAWGTVTVTTDDAAAAEPTWALANPEPSVTAPSPGLKTYAEFMQSLTDTKGLSDLAEIQARKQRKRKALKSFCNVNEPGEALAPALAELAKALAIPRAVAEASGEEELGRLGLGGGTCMLLPSFLLMLQGLKKAGRSFSLCFRTFGKDLTKIETEFNALCEGRHPLAPGNGVVLDGSDGEPDMRMTLDTTARRDGCGTLIRDANNELSLVLGSLEQPPPGAQAGGSKLKKFYENAGATVEVIAGAAGSAARLKAMLGCNAPPRTLALRDYYPGWEASGCQAHGGKPIMVERSLTTLEIFFDDHITAHDAHIIDARRFEAPTAAPLPIGATLGVHLIRAEPLESIRDPAYFSAAVASAEAQWRLQATRRAALASALIARATTQSGYRADDGTEVPASAWRKVVGPKYVPHGQTEQVLLRSTFSDHDVHEEELPEHFSSGGSVWLCR